MNNKKIFINDLEIEKRNDLIKRNSKLINMLQSDLYEVQMWEQTEAGDAILGKNCHEWIHWHDHYNSFYLTIKDYRKFLINVDAGYLSVDALKLHDVLIKKLDVLDSMDCWSDSWNNLDAWIEKKSAEILKEVERYLHDFERYPSEDDAIQYADEMEQLNDYYIEMRDGLTDGVIRKDIAYTECYI